MKTFSPARIFIILLGGVTLCAAGVALAASSVAAQRRTSPDAGASRGQRRVAPPAAVTCPRDNLTVYEGRITAYRRTPASTFLRIRTDAETTETVTLRHRRERSPAQWFLLRAERFLPRHWRLIESRNGRLRPDMRANIWVCTDGRNAVVDWQPPETEADR